MDHVREYWQDKLAKYSESEWSQQPSLFAQTALDYFPDGGTLLELGSGLGNDGAWFATKGYEVVCADLTTQPASPGTERVTLDMNQPLPFAGHSFDVVYSHLALHYFSLERTRQLFDEIYDVLRPHGVLAFLVNSVQDPEAGEGVEIEPNFKEIHEIKKRFFDLALAKQLTQKFEALLLDDHGTSYKDRADGLENLIRFIGKK